MLPIISSSPLLCVKPMRGGLYESLDAKILAGGLRNIR